jgi:hypothetical protein
MTVAHAGSTAPAVAASNENVVLDVQYLAVAAGRLAVLLAASAPEEQAPDAPVDAFGAWALLGSANGGDPTHTAVTAVTGVDRAHRTRAGAWWRVLGGTESGFMTLTATPSPNTITGCMSVYTSDTGLWEVPVLVSGVDTVHESGRSVTTGSLVTQAGDVLLAAWAGDNEVNTAITAPTITQAGATLGAATLRSRTLNNGGANSSMITADCVVTAGATGPVVAGFTGGGVNCGPGLIVRLRSAQPAGPTTVAKARVGGVWVETDLSGKVRFPGGPTITFGG